VNLKPAWYVDSVSAKISTSQYIGAGFSSGNLALKINTVI
jgi:hypothetical protein